jgi:hypothetical protein
MGMSLSGATAYGFPVGPAHCSKLWTRLRNSVCGGSCKSGVS